jgi:hypothetical protein
MLRMTISQTPVQWTEKSFGVPSKIFQRIVYLMNTNIFKLASPIRRNTFIHHSKFRIRYKKGLYQNGDFISD